jgi:hypothetical protein
MSESSYVRPSVSQLAAGHDRMGQNIEVDRWPQALAPSSLFTTLRDYSQFVLSLLAPGTEVPLGAMLERPIEVEPKLGLEWGLGMGIEHLQGRDYFVHWGFNPGFAALLIGAVERKRAIVVLTNGDAGVDLARDVVSLLWSEQHPLFSFRMLHPG